MKPPKFFNQIALKAQKRWEQLEADPELAGPWHQLFRQVQSPRHVVSELLQNADDAGAKSASVRIEDGVFNFEHDGGDFDAEQFASLCRFGFSNKRTLHTIGFRGVGFKSTFSLGDTVEVHSQTLAVCFKKKRFTEPVWLPSARPSQRTLIRVRIADRNRVSALRKNFEEWAQSPASLLFFNRLKELTIEGQVIRRQPLGKGPVEGSSWVKLVGAGVEKLLIVESDLAPFPAEAAEEIYAERGVAAEDLQLPACRVEIVLGLSETKRLYVVLPTGAELSLPFSCNAPFIQDTARYAIKDPAMSPTNRWLLERTGKLVGKAMLQWLGNSELPLKDRAEAYDLLEGATEFAPGLEGACSQIIMENMLAELNGQRLVLAAGGKLARGGECVAVPEELFSVWQTDQLLKLYGSAYSHLLAPEVSKSARSAIESHGLLASVDCDGALQRLEGGEGVPRPNTWPQLHALWTFVEKEIESDWSNERRRRMRIVPVDGSKVLHPANAVVRLSSRRDLLSAEDWKFVMDYAPTMDADWLAWISKRGPKKTTSANEENDPGYGLLQALALHEPSPVDRIAAQASLRIFSGKQPALNHCVRIAHVMAALGASLPSGFRFVTREMFLRESSHGVVVDETGRVEDVVPASWAKEHLLHEDYSRNFGSCTADAWRQWIRTPGSGLMLFVPIMETSQHLSSRASVTRFATGRGANEPAQFHYQRADFTVVDFGFPPELARHWEMLAKKDGAIWAAVMEGVLTAPIHHWKDATKADIRHNGTAYYKALNCGFIPAEWIVHLRSVACLADSHGKLHLPAELLLRTPDTEPLMGVESFVRAELDIEATKQLLKLLNVRDTPTGADKLLTRLHGMSALPRPFDHLAQISRLYEALDRIAIRCAPAELAPIVEAFNRRALVLTDAGEWMTSGEISIFPDEDSNSPTVHASLRNLPLWPRVGVSERPALERTIEWLKTLKSGAKFDAGATKRVRAALQRDPIRIWGECQHWLTLDSTWEPVAALKYRLTMQALMKWGELFPVTKGATANLQMLSADIAQLQPFVAIRNLAEAVEFRITRIVEAPDKGGAENWLPELATGLCRLKFPSDEETGRVRKIADGLKRTTWHAFTDLDVTPYLEGVPAGEPFRPKALWQETNFYVAGQPTARLHKELAEEMARPFAHSQVADAIAACIDRTPEFVAEYLVANFELDAQAELPPGSGNAAKGSGEDESASEGPQEEAAQEEAAQDHPGDEQTDRPEGKEDSEDESGDEGEEPGGEQSSRDRKEKTREPSFIARYAQSRGFSWHLDEHCYRHPNGAKIEKGEAPFALYEHANGKGVSKRLFVAQQSLATGVEIPYELWRLMEINPDSIALVLCDKDGQPNEWSAGEVRALKTSGQIHLHQSRFILREIGI